MDSRSKSISIADAKARLSELVSRAQAGEVILITRHGQPAARLVPVREVKEPLPSMAQFRSTIPSIGISTLDVLRQMREEER